MAAPQLIFSGLCSFLNPYNRNDNQMGDPAVILIRADKSMSSAMGHDPMPPMPADPSVGMNADSEVHTPFLAFDSNSVFVSDASGFVRVSAAQKDFWFLVLDGVELGVDGHAADAPDVQASFKTVVSKDAYWPQAKKQWNRHYVPVKGEKPKKSAVSAFFLLGKGKLSAARLSRVQWRFEIPESPDVHIGYFAEEVIYGDFPHTGDDNSLTITLKDLAGGPGFRTLTFTRRDPAQPITIFIGNNTLDGASEALKRESDPNGQPQEGKHVAFLNLVADSDLQTKGPIPTPVPVPVGLPPRPTGERDGGGGSAGFCGPGNANG